VKLIKLPAYCPELNPCELVFAKLKNTLRYHRQDKNLKQEVINCLSEITKENMSNFYAKCVSPKLVLPEFIL